MLSYYPPRQPVAPAKRRPTRAYSFRAAYTKRFPANAALVDRLVSRAALRIAQGKRVFRPAA